MKHRIYLFLAGHSPTSGESTVRDYDKEDAERFAAKWRARAAKVNKRPFDTLVVKVINGDGGK